MTTGLPPGWEVRHSNSRNLPYFFNPTTKESHWEAPSGTDTSILNTFLSSTTPSAPSSSTTEYQIRCAHLLIKHAESRRPSSWREEHITRSKSDALGIIEEHLRRIRDGQTTLGELATTESDDSSARKRGDLGFFGRGVMQAEFERAAFELEKGKVSGVVSTASGLHLIQRLE